MNSYKFYDRRVTPMVQLIVGKKGKGKTKQLLDKVNSEVKDISGSIVYLDKSTKHMYELNNKVLCLALALFAYNQLNHWCNPPVVKFIGIHATYLLYYSLYTLKKQHLFVDLLQQLYHLRI